MVYEQFYDEMEVAINLKPSILIFTVHLFTFFLRGICSHSFTLGACLFDSTMLLIPLSKCIIWILVYLHSRKSDQSYWM